MDQGAIKLDSAKLDPAKLDPAKLDPSMNLVWMDLEMSGLDPDFNRILEVACIVTDQELNVLAEGPVLAIYQTPEHLSQMDAWNQKHHGESGLLKRVQESVVSEAQAEQEILNFIQKYVGPKTAPLCGNSIYQDRRFIAKYMKALDQYLHYRLIDVSSLKELARRWMPAIFEQVKKKNAHLALDDIRESITELQFYRTHLFR